MFYTPPKSCPLCENSAVISSNHKCQDYYDNMQKASIFTSSQTYQPQTIAGKIDMLTNLTIQKIQEPVVAVPLSLLMEIYAELKFIESSTLPRQILEIVKGEK